MRICCTSEPATATVWSSDVRNGGRETTHLDNLYIASILAINADTGQLKWHYQCTPGDEWDYDAIQHLMLADIRINNRNRKVIMQANKNGYFYVIDRTNGEFISASEMSQVSWATGIDPKTGRPDIHPDALYSAEKGVDGLSRADAQHVADVVQSEHRSGLCSDRRRQHIQLRRRGNLHADPGPPELRTQSGAERAAARRWQTRLLTDPTARIPTAANVRGGILSAWDPATQKERWFALGGGQTGGGTLSLASNLVIQTLNNGRMKAFTADKGEQLLDIALPLTSGVGAPMTFMLDGKQYIAVMAGTGAAAGGAEGGGGGGRDVAQRLREPTAAAAQRGNNVPPAPTPALGPTTTRNCWFTLFRTEDVRTIEPGLLR